MRKRGALYSDPRFDKEGEGAGMERAVESFPIRILGVWALIPHRKAFGALGVSQLPSHWKWACNMYKTQSLVWSSHTIITRLLCMC